MLSKTLTEARPVRMLDISCCRSITALSMRAFAPTSTSFTLLKVLLAAAGCSGFMTFVLKIGSFLLGIVLQDRTSMDESSNGFSHRHSHYIAADVQIKHHDRQMIVAAHGNRRCVHYPQIARQDIGVTNLGEPDRVLVGQGIFVVDAVDASALDRKSTRL